MKQKKYKNIRKEFKDNGISRMNNKTCATCMNEHIAELFDKYCTARDCDTCKYNKDKRVVSGEIT